MRTGVEGTVECAVTAVTCPSSARILLCSLGSQPERRYSRAYDIGISGACLRSAGSCQCPRAVSRLFLRQLLLPARHHVSLRARLHVSLVSLRGALFLALHL